MDVIAKLATSLGRRDEIPNQELAAEIVAAHDAEAVAELVANLSNKNSGIANDCIKVLYEVGYSSPRLIADHIAAFEASLNSKNNRLQWGAMTALGCIVKEKADEIFRMLPRLIDVADSGTVITCDHCVNILISLSAIDEYADVAFPYLLKQLLTCPTNQLPMYAERTFPIINDWNRERFATLLMERTPEIEKDSKRKRVEKIIAKLRRSEQNK